MQSRFTVWDQQEPLRTRIGQVTGQFSSDVKLSGPFLVGFKPGILLLPYPLPKINPVIDNRRFLVRGFRDGGTHLIKMPKFLSNCREDVLPVSVLMLFFLGLYLLLAAFLITTFHGDYVTSSATPSACGPPNAFLRRTPRSKLAAPQSLCT